MSVLAVAPMCGGAQSFAYVANAGSNRVSAYAINPATGALIAIPGSPFPAGSEPVSVTVDATGRFVYVADLTGTVSACTINPATGALIAVPGSPFPAGSHSYSVTADPTGKFAYVANFFANTVSAYTINTATGALTPVPGSPFPAGAAPRSVIVDPTGKFVYAANYNDNTVSAYTIDPAVGALIAVPGSPFPAGSGSVSVIVDPTTTFAYVANHNDNTVSAYTINRATGALTPVPGSPFLAGNAPAAVTVDLTGTFAYAVNHDDNTVSAYTINRATGALTAVGAPFPAGLGPVSVTVDQTGTFAYVANYDGDTISAYTINRATGALTAVGAPFPAGSGPYSVVTTIAKVTANQVRYAANLAAGESYIDIGNSGAASASLPGAMLSSAGNICVSVYAIDPSGNLDSCCSCLVTPDQVVHLGANADLVSNTATPAKPASITIKLIASLPVGGATATSCAFQAASLTAAQLTPGMVAWGTTLHPAPRSSTTYVTTETPFSPATVSAADLASLTGRCAAIVGNNSGFGICASCQAGAMGASKM
ncbi:MAG: lactonase family protein [Bryobacteraceae bacterium]